jgi:hypothetical protein
MHLTLLTIAAIVGLIASLVAQTDGAQFREISMEALRDKVQGDGPGK